MGSASSSAETVSRPDRYNQLASANHRTLESRDDEPREDGNVFDSKYHELWKQLPPWGYHEEVKALAESAEFERKPMPMGVAVGPAVLLARRSAMIGWVSVPVFTGIYLATSKCNPGGFVDYHWTFCLLFLPMIFSKIYLQWRVIQYFTIPYVQSAGEFEFFVRSFKCWFFTTLFLSVTSMADYASDSFFLAVVWRTNQCHDQQLVEEWRKIMLQSSIPFCSIIPFTWLVWISYYLMLLQPLYGFLNSLPTAELCCASDVEYVVGTSMSTGRGDELRNQYQTIVDKLFTKFSGVETQQNMGDALFALAEISDMVSIQAISTRFPEFKAKGIANGQGAQVEKIERILRLTRNALQRIYARIGLLTIAESCFQSNLQVSVLGMFKYLSSHSTKPMESIEVFQGQTVFSVATSIFMAGVRMCDVIDVVRFANWSLDECGKEIGPDERQPTEEERKTIDGSLRDVRISKWVIIFLTFLFLGADGYAVVKLVHVFLCKDSVWNISGCVDMGAV